LVAKQSRQGLKGDHAWYSYQLSFVAETTWSPKWGKFTPKWPNSSQKGSLGALIHPQNGRKSRNFKIVQIRPLIARSENLAKADLMSPPPELFIFFAPLNRPVSSGLTGWAQLNKPNPGTCYYAKNIFPMKYLRELDVRGTHNWRNTVRTIVAYII
jgi:hypothetical protein